MPWDFPDEFPIYMYTCWLIAMNSFKAQRKADWCQATGNSADQSKQYLIPLKTMTGTHAESDRSIDISSNKTTFQSSYIRLQAESLAACSPWGADMIHAIRYSTDRQWVITA